jgi:flagellar basal body rod protein FlgC
MVNLMTAQRGYDANATAFETAKTMVQRGLEIVR